MSKPALRKLLLAALAGFFLVVSADRSTAHTGPCGERKKLVAELAKKFDEHRQAVGLVSANSVLEVFVSKQGNWTILMSSTTGMACILAAGSTWNQHKAILGSDV